MANATLEALKAEVTRVKEVDESAIVLINGIAARITAAVAAAIANGATAEELAPVTDEVASLKSNNDALAAAVVANTPAA